MGCDLNWIVYQKNFYESLFPESNSWVLWTGKIKGGGNPKWILPYLYKVDRHSTNSISLCNQHSPSAVRASARLLRLGTLIKGWCQSLSWSAPAEILWVRKSGLMCLPNLAKKKTHESKRIPTTVIRYLSLLVNVYLIFWNNQGN